MSISISKVLLSRLVQLIAVLGYCHSQYSMPVRRHGEHKNSYEREQLIRVCLQFQMLSLFLSWWGAWRHTGRHGAEEEVESSTSESTNPQAAGKESDTGRGLGF